MARRSLFGLGRSQAELPGQTQVSEIEFEPLDRLALPPGEIFDHEAVNAAVSKIITSEGEERRSAAVSELALRRDIGREALEKKCRSSLLLSPFASLRIIRSYAYLTDGLVQTALEIASSPGGGQKGPSEPFSVAAVGGYGRGDMAPGSDVDLLFLNEGKISPWLESVIESTLYMLWDIKLKVGHSCRSARDCVRLGKDDYTIRTALLENRFIYGSGTLAADLHNQLWRDLFRSTGPEFVEAKLAEREARYERQSGNRYLLEPNVKESKGGLRDLQTLYWIEKYLYGVTDPRELVELDVFSIEEFEKFISAESFLWSVRCLLHLNTGRTHDQLHFDFQDEIAEGLGYEDARGRRAVEHFMQDYFRHATAVGELTRIFLTKLEAQHVKREPRLVGFLRGHGLKFGTRTSEGYKINLGRLDIEDEEAFLKDPLNLLRLFQEALKTGLLMHPDAMRLVAANLFLIDDDFRSNAEANRIFLDVLLNYGNPERALRRMNELGVLGMFVPEFRDIVALMQFGSYHSYTVDEHTLQCISTLAEIEREELKEDLPVASGILKQGVNRRVLYIALLLHDIGKGRGGDHAARGAAIAGKLAPRLGLDENETELVVWLVENHLLMSDVAQKRDLSDPRTVRDFARHVGNRARLKLLTVLTVCDIRGVGPKVWNNWKAQLIRDLYFLTRSALTEGMPIAISTSVEDSKDAFRSAVEGWGKERVDEEIERHFDPYWLGLDTDAHKVFAHMLQGMEIGEIRSDFKLDEGRDATRLCCTMTDRPGLFASFAGILAIVGANVVDAKTFVTSDGFSTSAFWVQDAQGQPLGKNRMNRISTMIDKLMVGEMNTGKALKDKDRMTRRIPSVRRERKFVVPTEITFDNEGSEIYTIIEVDTRDRPGLLFDLANTLYGANVAIASAVIATYGVQAVDVFYVKDLFGLKLHSKSRRESLRQKLRVAIEEGNWSKAS